MTTDKFNEKYKDYIEEGHYGLDIENENIIKYLDDVFKDLIKIPGFKYSQIKEKFGWLRFYIELCNDAVIYDYIRTAEENSSKICHYCGTTENLGHTTGWILISCEECATKHNKTWVAKNE